MTTATVTNGLQGSGGAGDTGAGIVRAVLSAVTAAESTTAAVAAGGGAGVAGAGILLQSGFGKFSRLIACQTRKISVCELRHSSGSDNKTFKNSNLTYSIECVCQFGKLSATNSIPPWVSTTGLTCHQRIRAALAALFFVLPIPPSAAVPAACGHPLPAYTADDRQGAG